MDELTAALNANLRPEIAERIIASIQPTIRIGLTPLPDDQIPIGSSKFGGLPDLAPDTDWPWNDAGKTLPFLAQINCAELPIVAGSGLPNHGLLSFFYNDEEAASLYPGDTGDWAVLWQSDVDGLRRHEPVEVSLLLDSAVCSFEVGPSFIPPWENITDAEERFFETTKGDLDPMPRHRLLGVGEYIQHPVLYEVAGSLLDCYRKKDPTCWDQARQDASDWRMLLQVDSDDDLDIMWGDSGIVSFAIRADDLARQDFSRVRANYQCH